MKMGFVGIVARTRMATQHIAFALALICPLGALAVEPAIGSETDGRKTARVAGWTPERQVNAGGTVSGESRPARLASRERDAHGADQVYRYGRREPALEELPLTGRAPAVVDVSAHEY